MVGILEIGDLCYLNPCSCSGKDAPLPVLLGKENWHPDALSGAQGYLVGLGYASGNCVSIAGHVAVIGLNTRVLMMESVTNCRRRPCIPGA